MAVYTQVADEELACFLLDYDLGKARRLEGIAEGVENSNFILETAKGRYILTLFEKRVATTDLPFFLGLMGHLAKQGVVCPVPIPRKDGETLSNLCGRSAAIIGFLAGQWPRQVEAQHCQAVGKAQAHLHRKAQNFNMKRENALGIKAWRPLFDQCQPRADRVQAGLSQLLEAELDFLEENWPSQAALPRGIIHADLFRDNVFFVDRHLSGIIDFYFACNDFLAYDVAICLTAWCFGPDRRFDRHKGTLYLQAYQDERALSQAEIAALPILARGAAMRFLLTRLYDWLNHDTTNATMVKPKDPLEFLAYLRFHQAVKSATDCGLQS